MEDYEHTCKVFELLKCPDFVERVTYMPNVVVPELVLYRPEKEAPATESLHVESVMAANSPNHKDQATIALNQKHMTPTTVDYNSKLKVPVKITTNPIPDPLIQETNSQEVVVSVIATKGPKEEVPASSDQNQILHEKITRMSDEEKRQFECTCEMFYVLKSHDFLNGPLVYSPEAEYFDIFPYIPNHVVPEREFYRTENEVPITDTSNTKPEASVMTVNSPQHEDTSTIDLSSKQMTPTTVDYDSILEDLLNIPQNPKPDTSIKKTNSPEVVVPLIATNSIKKEALVMADRSQIYHEKSTRMSDENKREFEKSMEFLAKLESHNRLHELPSEAKFLVADPYNPEQVTFETLTTREMVLHGPEKVASMTGAHPSNSDELVIAPHCPDISNTSELVAPMTTSVSSKPQASVTALQQTKICGTADKLMGPKMVNYTSILEVPLTKADCSKPEALITKTHIPNTQVMEANGPKLVAQSMTVQSQYHLRRFTPISENSNKEFENTMVLLEKPKCNQVTNGFPSKAPSSNGPQQTASSMANNSPEQGPQVTIAHSQNQVAQSTDAYQSKIYLRRFTPISKNSKKEFEVVMGLIEKLRCHNVIVENPLEAKLPATGPNSPELVTPETVIDHLEASGPADGSPNSEVSCISDSPSQDKASGSSTTVSFGNREPSILRFIHFFFLRIKMFTT